VTTLLISVDSPTTPAGSIVPFGPAAAVILGSGGALGWQKALGGLDQDHGRCIAHGGDGGFVLAGDTADTLAARVLAVEHILYPLAAENLCRSVQGGSDPCRLSPPGQAFQIAPTFEPDQVRQQISEALSGAL